MSVKDEMKNRSRLRNKRGHGIPEFGAAMVVFICFFLTPIIDLSFVPLRYVIAQGVVTELTHRLSLSEKRSDAYTLLGADTWWQTFLSNFGVTAHNPKLRLVVCGHDSSNMTSVNTALGSLSDEWLPEGANAPCVYSLELSVDCELPPLFNFNVGLPGFTEPLTMTIKSRSQWENLGRDPQTSKYFVNE
ncbi:MAG: hypothetical protein K2X93_10735 [Candidatus Obscuribacterales bacterium]|nr:hypothetical protein [Candidatus Obscuribacterales bacterium]